MSVAAEQVHQAVPRKPHHEPLGLGFGDKLGRPLNQSTIIGESPQTLGEVSAGVTLGMGDHGPQPPTSESLHNFVQAIAERSWSRLQQDPSSGPACASSFAARPSVPAERHRTQLGVAQVVRLCLRQLPAGEDSNADSLSIQVRLQRVHTRDDLLDAHVVVVPYMGCRAHRRDPVPLGLARHREAVIEVARAIVEPRQDVTVQIDHGSAYVPERAFSGVMRVTLQAG